MITFAFPRERNHSGPRHSSRNSPSKLTATPFCKACLTRSMLCRCLERRFRTAASWTRTPPNYHCARCSVRHERSHGRDRRPMTRGEGMRALTSQFQLLSRREPAITDQIRPASARLAASRSGLQTLAMERDGFSAACRAPRRNRPQSLVRESPEGAGGWSVRRRRHPFTRVV
jgi:hypothetical protein